MIVGNPTPKVLNYSNEKARVYHADENGGDIQFGQKVEVQMDLYGHM